MAIVEYVRPLGERTRIRHHHETRRGKLMAFVVQLEIELGGAWTPLVRYDTAHGRAHMDLYATPTRKTKQPLDLSPAEAMTLAEEDIKENWERYQEEFLRRNTQ